MTDRAHKLSLTRQTELLGISRGSLCYAPRPVSEDDLRLMRRIDELRRWRTIKYEEVYLRTCDSVTAARESLGPYLAFYNTVRPHSALGW